MARLQAIEYLTPATRGEICVILNERILPSCYDLFLQLSTAHWNVQGSGFIGIHKLLDEIRDSVYAQNDVMSERVRQLGCLTNGSIQNINEKTSLPKIDINAFNAVEVSYSIEQTIEAIQFCSSLIWQNLAQIQSLKDAVTLDILTETTRKFDKYTWLLRSNT